MENVYLIPGEADTFSAVIANTSPEDGLLLAEVGTFPVELTVKRSDANGSSELISDWYSDREELLSALNWHGQARNSIIELWYYTVETASNDMLCLFNRLFSRKAKIAREDAELMSALLGEE